MTTTTLDRPAYITTADALNANAVLVNAETQAAIATPPVDVVRLSALINELAALIGALPTLNGVQHGWLVELLVTLRCEGVAVDTLYCAVDEAAGEKVTG